MWIIEMAKPGLALAGIGCVVILAGVWKALAKKNSRLLLTGLGMTGLGAGMFWAAAQASASV